MALRVGDNLTVYDVDGDDVTLVDDGGEKHTLDLRIDLPRVLITVTGGVASYESDIGVDVLLVDYDDDPDQELPDGWANHFMDATSEE